MKTDLATSIGLAIVGVIISYLICNILVGTWATDSYNIKTIESTVSADVASPDPEIFNYQRLLITVYDMSERVISVHAAVYTGFHPVHYLGLL